MYTLYCKTNAYCTCCWAPLLWCPAACALPSLDHQYQPVFSPLKNYPTASQRSMYRLLFWDVSQARHKALRSCLLMSVERSKSDQTALNASSIASLWWFNFPVWGWGLQIWHFHIPCWHTTPASLVASRLPACQHMCIPWPGAPKAGSVVSLWPPFVKFSGCSKMQ